MNRLLCLSRVGARQLSPVFFIAERRVLMPRSTENNRVLGRMFGREISAEEAEQVTGGILTHVCTFDFKTCTPDGDGCETIPQCP